MAGASQPSPVGDAAGPGAVVKGPPVCGAVTAPSDILRLRAHYTAIRKAAMATRQKMRALTACFEPGKEENNN